MLKEKSIETFIQRECKEKTDELHEFIELLPNEDKKFLLGFLQGYKFNIANQQQVTNK